MSKRKFHLNFSSLKSYAPDYEPIMYNKIRTGVVCVGTILALAVGVYGLFHNEGYGFISKKHIVYFSGVSLIGI